MENQIYRICCAEYTCFSATHLNALLRHMAYFENEASLKSVEMLILHAHPASAIDKTLYHRTCKIFRFDFGPIPISILFLRVFATRAVEGHFYDRSFSPFQLFSIGVGRALTRYILRQSIHV